MSRILIEIDNKEEAYLVDFWISQKGNLCWKHSGYVYVKMWSGYTMMTKEGESKWTRSNVHTRADPKEVSAVTATEQPIRTRFIG